MYKKELLDLIKTDGKGLLTKIRDYKVVLKEAKEEAEKENRKYDYSLVYSIVYDGVDSLKLTYIDYPSVNKDPYFDHDKQYTNFKYLTIPVSRINDLTFVE